MKVDLVHLRDRIKRSLGSPIVTPTITNNQLDQAIDDALKLFSEYHYRGSYKDYLIIRVNDENVARTNVFQLNENVLAITNILKTGSNFSLKGLANFDGSTNMWFTQMFTQAFGGLGGSNCSIGLSGLSGTLPFFTILDMNIGLWEREMKPSEEFIYNTVERTLMVPNAKLGAGSIVVAEAYLSSSVGVINGSGGNIIGSSSTMSYEKGLDEWHNYTNLHGNYKNHNNDSSIIGGEGLTQGAFDDRWVIEYATARAKYIWGMNLTYVSGVSQSSGGVKIDGQTLKEEAQVEMNSLRRELMKNGEQPTMMIG